EFRQGAFHCFIATDVAARGIDFENVTHVFQYDFPTGKENYVHRAGRTGRNGKTGASISLLSEADRRMKTEIEEYIGQELKPYPWKEKENIEQSEFLKRQKAKVVRREKKGAILNKNITRLAIGGGKKSKMRAVDLVGTLCSIEGMKDSDIGIIDIRESLSYVEILNGKGKMVYEVLQEKPIKGKLRKVRMGRV
ncbi:MAG: DbpA RNA binding domain-containing protein, partial [Acetivibrio sp.]